MRFRFDPMTASDAQAIVDWHYPGIYSFYDMNQDPDDLAEWLDPHNWADKFFAVHTEVGELVGFFYFEKEAETVVVGLGLRPDYTDRGIGQGFVAAGLEFAQQRFSPSQFRSNVAAFNERAIKIYERAGFRSDGRFMNKTNGRQYEFLRMVRDVE